MRQDVFVGACLIPAIKSKIFLISFFKQTSRQGDGSSVWPMARQKNRPLVCATFIRNIAGRRNPSVENEGQKVNLGAFGWWVMAAVAYPAAAKTHLNQFLEEGIYA